MSRTALLGLFTCLTATAAALLCASPAAAQAPALEITAETLPAEVPEAAVSALADGSLTLSMNGSPVMNLWLVSAVPAATGKVGVGGLNYAAVPVGTFMGVMQLVAPHIDYRDQLVPVGTYALRYLQQPVDGNHIGVTFFRDFLVLTPLETASDLQALSSEDTLDAAMLLNTHPFAWGLWPANEVAVATPPGLAAVDGNKWALELELPRTEGDPLRLAVVLVGSEPPDGYGYF